MSANITKDKRISELRFFLVPLLQYSSGASWRRRGQRQQPGTLQRGAAEKAWLWQRRPGGPCLSATTTRVLAKRKHPSTPHLRAPCRTQRGPGGPKQSAVSTLPADLVEQLSTAHISDDLQHMGRLIDPMHRKGSFGTTASRGECFFPCRSSELLLASVKVTTAAA